ncbi:glutamine synthetase family protein [Thalassobius sp. Cn5-15]|uniref:glutamine synthetase family protein n=1 Tax=Thalassobius sp. Cn5-15 TaxID=2917763 RepID=UPI001EF384C2|nr:glutamine synthetase family protein [Thalassobius sp. Cn5-15]MCG7493027.1 glutamine synthetase family protein [Thalassobius sp. Cn5-15]
MKDWLSSNPDVRSVRLAAADLNGVPRGKRIPSQFAGKLAEGTARFPYSVLNLDIWGGDIENSPLVFESGDQDGFLHMTDRGPLPMPWLDNPAALVPVWMVHEDGTPYDGDPRHALQRVLDRYTARGLSPVAAVELEFFLVDDSGEGLEMPALPTTGKKRARPDILSLATLDAFDGFFSDLYAACDAMGIPADAAISEAAKGQFEINLMHGDAMKAADDAWLFKMLVKGLARKHGCAATFMTKPYADEAGTGLHTHFSVLDQDGNNVFDDGSDTGSDTLRHAIAGCMAAMRDSTLVFAPHAASYDRMVPGAHAPTSICWAHENRTAAIRVPSGPPQARRIEHRVAGGDVNPYLMLAAILGAALNGIEDGVEPPAPITGNSYDQELPQIITDWAEAIDTFETSAEVARLFPTELIRNMVLTKRQELREIANMDAAERLETYLESV